MRSEIVATNKTCGCIVGWSSSRVGLNETENFITRAQAYGYEVQRILLADDVSFLVRSCPHPQTSTSSVQN